MQWTVERLSNDTYRIQNIDHSSYANAENGSWAKQGDSIVGITHRQQWKIMEMPAKGDYWCVLYPVQILILNNG